MAQELEYISGLTAQQAIAVLIERHEQREPFSLVEIELDAASAERFVEFRSNPPRFLARIFDGDWANPARHPALGRIRILRVMTGNDGVTRVIGRQDKRLYATPWIS